MGNTVETVTEDQFRKALTAAGITEENGYIIDRQRSSDEQIADLFANASKQGTGREGRPDFIIQSKDFKKMLMVVECKAKLADLDLAASEAGWYAEFAVKGGYDVVVVAVAGHDSDFQIGSAIWCKRDGKNKLIRSNNEELGFYSGRLYSFGAYEYFINGKPKGFDDNARALAQKLKEIMSGIDGVKDWKSMLLASGCMISLRDRAFREGYHNYEYDDLLEAMLNAIGRVLKKYGVAQEKIKMLVSHYSELNHVAGLTKEQLDKKNQTIRPLVLMLDTIHNSSIHSTLESTYITNFDVMGEFYTTFLTGNKKRNTADNAEGFVLTPQHITELFVKMAKLTPYKNCLDVCFGTGGFLVSALNAELKACTSEVVRDSVKRNNMYGIEKDSTRYTYGCINMILRGDGKSNLYQGDCFDPEVQKAVRDKCEVGFMNPPYSGSNTNIKLELEFIDNMLDLLKVGGTGIVIVPTRVASDTKKEALSLRKKLLGKHTLKACMTMPTDLFNPSASTCTCILVFTAHVPHGKNAMTWIADWSDDGFIIKNYSRIDADNKWSGIREGWLDAYEEERDGNQKNEGFQLCMRKHLTENDNWLYKYNKEVDFSTLNESEFMRTMQDYLLFQLSQRRA